MEEPVREQELVVGRCRDRSECGEQPWRQPRGVRKNGEAGENRRAQQIVRSIEVPKGNRDTEHLEEHAKTQRSDREEHDRCAGSGLILVSLCSSKWVGSSVLMVPSIGHIDSALSKE